MNLSIPRNATPALIAMLLLAVAGCDGSAGGTAGGSTGGSDPGTGGNPVAPPTATGSATLSWKAPTQNEDGTALSNLAGYKVRYGTNAEALNRIVDIANPAKTTVTIQGLTPGTWYFTLSAYTNTGIESDHTNPVSKTIG